MLLADRIQIQQVVTNLILNSTEVMESVEPEMRKLIIELSTTPSTLRRRSLLRQGYGGQALRLCSGQVVKLRRKRREGRRTKKNIECRTRNVEVESRLPREPAVRSR